MIFNREINKVYNENFLKNNLPDKCAQLIIADPPYFEVKGEFDFIWKSFDDYLKDVDKWAVECKRLLSDNGTLFWWGHALKIAYSQIILDKYFNIENVIKWRKTDCQTRVGYNNFRSFPPVTEHLLMYSNGNDYHKYMRLSLKNVQNYLKTLVNVDELSNIMIDNGFCKNLASAISNSKSILTQEAFKPQMISEKQYNFINKPKIKYSELYEIFIKDKNYEDERRRYFNNYMKHDDVWDYAQDVHLTGNYDHDTKKTERISRIIINTCSRSKDLVLVPFAGSGTECAMALKEGRDFIGFDIEEKYVKMANKRCDKIKSEPTLF